MWGGHEQGHTGEPFGATTVDPVFGASCCLKLRAVDSHGSLGGDGVLRVTPRPPLAEGTGHLSAWLGLPKTVGELAVRGVKLVPWMRM